MSYKTNRERRPSTAERKIDPSENGDRLEELVSLQTQRERHLFPLRINRTTVIYVTKEKHTPEYAERFKRKMLRER